MTTDKAIVLMWKENTGIRLTGRLIKRDGNWFEETEACEKGYACVFSRDLKELGRAEDYAKGCGKDEGKVRVRIVVMEDTEDILERARKMALE